MRKYDKLIFELSKSGRKAYNLPELDVEDKCIKNFIPEEFLSDTELNFPELSEVDVIRHYTNLSNKNYGLDTGFYPLGSCTMKYNPKINEDTARLDGFANVHPLQMESCTQGSLQLLYELDKSLAEIAGMDKMSLQPAAGAHGELTGIMVIKAYHEKNGDFNRNKIIVPDSAHGTNPATAAMAGYKIVEVKSTKDGLVDLEALKAVVGDDTAGLMLTNPNTLGIFDKNIKEIAKIVHDAGGQLYYDGANANAILGHARPGDMGFDVVHFNLHKTFSTPHGGGGPGAGPIGVKKHLVEFLPVPLVEKDEDRYYLDYNLPNTIGKVKDFYGHFGILVRAYTYILTMGSDGLKKASEIAVLNANYMANKLKDYYYLPIDTLFKHEFVLGGLKDTLSEVSTLDIAKRLLDHGYHPPTVYFPLIINQAIMIEPTESESKETMDEFIEAMISISKEASEDPEKVKAAPLNTVVSRPDETRAARTPVLKYEG
ncbi:aminomethyl-transferring glycine dehydrogenase subunit GcvPB [Tissierella sp.]|uniref:aminomethyl-transferring glycine dehydrogenase subunit GcvPB n=1 Tax=Tissierella sp. TaxID=41274 RepID=UPI002863FED9|nr:aminomethyl-transferring glycine dehydrogenase subunit GcvPB [Tissierella sp.]MDR7857670.1 aminomethyl-transferring glycine dehydrogenase subunit GcvPB [Tissierella sp.]